VVILKAILFLEGHESDKGVTSRITLNHTMVILKVTSLLEWPKSDIGMTSRITPFSCTSYYMNNNNHAYLLFYTWAKIRYKCPSKLCA
jgi:hypothetical protein